jgi:hypothetical protein
MEWDKEGNVSCVLAFGGRRENVFIHHDDLRAAFSPDAGVQFVRNDMTGAREPGPGPGPAQGARREEARQVVSLSRFKKERRKRS